MSRSTQWKMQLHRLIFWKRCYFSSDLVFVTGDSKKKIIWGKTSQEFAMISFPFGRSRGPFFFQFFCWVACLDWFPPWLRLDALMTSRSLMPLGDIVGRVWGVMWNPREMWRNRETLDEIRETPRFFIYGGSFLSESDSSVGCCKKAGSEKTSLIWKLFRILKSTEVVPNWVHEFRVWGFWMTEWRKGLQKRGWRRRRRCWWVFVDLRRCPNI